MKRIRLGENQQASGVFETLSWIVGATLLFVAARHAGPERNWRWLLGGSVALVGTLAGGAAISRRAASAYVVVLPDTIRVFQFGPCWRPATFATSQVERLVEQRASDTELLWSLSLHFVDRPTWNSASFLSPAVHETIDEINDALRNART